jgi:hypothetical protein
MGIRQAWLDCRSPHRARHVIWLPQPIPSCVDARSAEWRDLDWAISLLCIDCGCAYDYSVKDIRVRDSAQDGRIVTLCIECECGYQGCSERIGVFTTALDSLSLEELRKDSREWDFRCMCARGHFAVRKSPSGARSVGIKRAPFPWGALGVPA